ncbi:MAG TPA: DUF3048 domain-containing protein [Terrimesophilobacter sp.]|nr:DUF3048 domain-containing protein [Terrimesophilobacter sp.]HRP99666.1 DUF3048 domain-containing protein [Terrimesophilobacter sp.]
MARLSTKRHRRAAVPLLVVAVALTGCVAEPMPTPSASPSASVVPAYVDTYVEPEPTQLAPLRGTTVAAGSVSGPALSAKVDNHPNARPQFGLEHTDIVYEELVEGGMTRYVAIWQSTVPDLIGPVRSIRPMDPDIISPYRGIVAYSGGQYRFVVLMQQTPVVNAIHGQNNTRDTFYRVRGRPGPHDVLVRAPQVVSDFGPLDAPQQNWAFAATADASSAAREGVAASIIHYRFSGLMWGTWTYSAETERYYRAQANRGPDLDTSGNQLTASNVVVLRVDITHATGVPQTILNTTGEAWVFSGGHVIHGSFSKASQNEPIYLYDDNGFTIRLAAGNTWVELIPHAGSISFE